MLHSGVTLAGEQSGREWAAPQVRGHSLPVLQAAPSKATTGKGPLYSAVALSSSSLAQKLSRGNEAGGSQL